MSLKRIDYVMMAAIPAALLILIYFCIQYWLSSGYECDPAIGMWFGPGTPVSEAWFLDDC